MAVQTKTKGLHVDIGQPLGRNLRRRAVLVQATVAEYTDTSGTKYYPILLPSGARIIDLWVDVMTAFNSGTSDVVDVGYKLKVTTTEDVDAFIDNQDIKTAAKVRFGMAVGADPFAVGQPLTEDTYIVVTTTRTGTAATAGKIRIVVKYILDDSDTTDAVDYGA